MARPIGIDNLIDRESKRFKEKGLAFMSPGRVTQVLLDDPLLAKTPVVRDGARATLGYQPEAWKRWSEEK